MKKILSIDGGGIRGIIPLACLVELEKIHRKPCQEIFDMVAGTSTGALIAAGVALGISARGLLALYRELAKHAFERLPLHQILFNLGNHRYSNTFIANTLHEIGADRPLNSLMVDVLITAKNLETSRTDFFVKDGPGNAGHWGTMSLVDAVLASIAAPTYFPAPLCRRSRKGAYLGRWGRWSFRQSGLPRCRRGDPLQRWLIPSGRHTLAFFRHRKASSSNRCPICQHLEVGYLGSCGNNGRRWRMADLCDPAGI